MGTELKFYLQCLVGRTVISLSLTQLLKNGTKLSMSNANVIIFNSARTPWPHHETDMLKNNSFTQSQCNLNGLYDLFFILHKSFSMIVVPS